jgi:hypothetical protein
MHVVESLSGLNFPKDVKHKTLKLNPSKEPRVPSPRDEDVPGHEHEILEEDEE